MIFKGFRSQNSDFSCSPPFVRVQDEGQGDRTNGQRGLVPGRGDAGVPGHGHGGAAAGRDLQHVVRPRGMFLIKPHISEFSLSITIEIALNYLKKGVSKFKWYLILTRSTSCASTRQASRCPRLQPSPSNTGTTSSSGARLRGKSASEFIKINEKFCKA